MTRSNAFGRIYAILEHACPKTIKRVDIMLSSPSIILGQYTRQYQDAGEPHLEMWAEALEALGPDDLEGNIPQSQQGDFWVGYYAAKTAMRSPKDMLSTKEVAQALGIDPATVRQQLGKGRFPGAKREGRDWTIPAADVAAYRR